MYLSRKLIIGLSTVTGGGVLIGVAILALAPTFGGRVVGDRLTRAMASPQYRNGHFDNVVPQAARTSAMTWDYAKRQFMGSEVRRPAAAIPVVAMDRARAAQMPAAGLRAIWFGHASVYLEFDGLRLMVDPILSDYASPIAGMGPKRFHPPPLALDAMPKIDAVMISHDHYDHLDMPTIKRFAANGTRFFVPLGIGAHLDRWGVPAAQITELDWWQSADIGGLKITSTPVRHYSGRGLRDGNATLWSSWAIVGATRRVYFSGNSGFGDHFKTVGDRHGPFDLSLIKVGAYGPHRPWIDIHMDPEDAVKAHVALRAQRMLPVHWGTFNLGFHAWDEPIKRTVAAARAANVELVTPRVGEIVDVGTPFASMAWWELVVARQ